MEQNKKTGLILNLFDAGCIKFGEFTLKSSGTSPIYVDMRRLISFPRVFKDIISLMSNKLDIIKGDVGGFDYIAGVPLAGLPIMGALITESGYPAIFPRPPKDHGTKAAIEGAFERSIQVVLIDDVVTDGASKIEAAKPLFEASLAVPAILVVVDRQQGARDILCKRGIFLYSLFTLSEIVEVLYNQGKIDQSMVEKVETYIAENQFK